MTINDLVKNNKLYLLLVMLGGLALGIAFFFAFRYLKTSMGMMFAMGIIALCTVIIVKKVVRLLWALLCLCFVINFDITIGYNGHLGGAAGIIISLYDLVLVMLYFLWIVDFILKKKVEINFFPQISIPAVCLFISMFISMVDAGHPILGIYEWLEVFKFYLSFLYIANNIKRQKDLSFLLFFMMLGFMLEGVLGVLQHRTGDPLAPTLLGAPSYLVNDRVAGTWVSYNDFSTYLTFFIPLSFILIFTDIPMTFRMMYGVALVGGGASLIWTNSRGGWMSCGISFFFMFIMLSGKIKNKEAVIKVFLGAIVAFILISPIYPRVTEKIVGRFTGDDNGSAESRLPQFQVAWNIIRANPINGIGFNNYTKVMLDYDDTEEGLLTITRFPVHNIYLHTLAEQGVIGILAFAYFLVSIFMNGIKYILKYKDQNSSYIAAMLAGILAFLIHLLADCASMGNKLYLYIWFFTGLIMAMTQNRENMAKKG